MRLDMGRRIESFKNWRNDIIKKEEGILEESLYKKPKVSDRAKVQAGWLAGAAGMAGIGLGAAHGNRVLMAASAITEMISLNSVSTVGHRADMARRVIREKVQQDKQ